MTALAQIDYAAPLSLVDEVRCCEPRRIVTRCLLRASEPVFAGHYPHDPVFPGVLMVEAVVQACRILAERHALRLELRELSSIRFHAALRPGDRFELDCELSEPDADEGVRVNAKIVAITEDEPIVACVCRLQMECAVQC